jgi:hypothetical protein
LPPETAQRALVKSSVQGIGSIIRKAKDMNIRESFSKTISSLQDKFRQKPIAKSPLDFTAFPPVAGDVEIKSVPDGGTVYGDQRTTFEARKKTAQIKKRAKKQNMKKDNVLITGIYLANQANAIEHIVTQLNQSENYKVIQKWAALFGDAPSQTVKAVTTLKIENPQPKFVLLNKILSAEELNKYRYIVICDDDIRLCDDFLDNFLDFQEEYDFALAQPARTHNSYIDHPFVEQFEGLKARRTRFVEIGPLVSIRRDAFSALLPFDESSYMGWGYDFVWPALIEKMGLRMGIIDATPIEHSMRKPVKNYNYDQANKSQQDYLSRNPHLSKEEAFSILESYA